MMVIEAMVFRVQKEISQNCQETALESCKINYIYDDEPLGFEKDPFTSTKNM